MRTFRDYLAILMRILSAEGSTSRTFSGFVSSNAPYLNIRLGQLRDDFRRSVQINRDRPSLRASQPSWSEPLVSPASTNDGGIGDQCHSPIAYDEILSLDWISNGKLGDRKVRFHDLFLQQSILLRGKPDPEACREQLQFFLRHQSPLDARPYQCPRLNR